MHTRLAYLAALLFGCAQAVVPDDSGSSFDESEASAPTPDGGADVAVTPVREGTYFGDYVISSGGGGTMMLTVKDDGFVMLVPKDVNASGTGTIDESGVVSVDTQYDMYAQSPLHFSGTVTFDGTKWKASGKVSPMDISNQSGTWAATRE